MKHENVNPKRIKRSYYYSKQTKTESLSYQNNNMEIGYSLNHRLRWWPCNISKNRCWTTSSNYWSRAPITIAIVKHFFPNRISFYRIMLHRRIIRKCFSGHGSDHQYHECCSNNKKKPHVVDTERHASCLI